MEREALPTDAVSDTVGTWVPTVCDDDVVTVCVAVRVWLSDADNTSRDALSGADRVTLSVKVAVIVPRVIVVGSVVVTEALLWGSLTDSLKEEERGTVGVA